LVKQAVAVAPVVVAAVAAPVVAVPLQERSYRRHLPEKIPNPKRRNPIFWM
jgi:hypothetical protein